MIVAALLGAAFFTLAAFVGASIGNVVADTLQRFDDGPPPGHPPVPWLIGASAVIGAFAATHAAAPSQLLFIAIVCTALVAAWCCDVRTGIVPDLFTLVPLAMMLAVALWQHEWWLWISAFVPFVPFALAALLSRGRGMGWGDVKLVALGGAVLGAQLSLLAFALACVVAVGVNYFWGRKRGAIAFAPYLVAAIGAALPIGMLR
jgi:leader peptidase (prepilin peptidase)/N-methyltransferase